MDRVNLKELQTEAAVRVFPPEMVEKTLRAVCKAVDDRIVHSLDSWEHAAACLKE